MPKRRNLLITTIGRLEYYKSWLSDDRNYDIALIYYPEKIDPLVKLELKKAVIDQFDLDNKIEYISKVPREGTLPYFMASVKRVFATDNK